MEIQPLILILSIDKFQEIIQYGKYVNEEAIQW